MNKPPGPSLLPVRLFIWGIVLVTAVCAAAGWGPVFLFALIAVWFSWLGGMMELAEWKRRKLWREFDAQLKEESK